jgi:hypothetical protein
LFVFVQTLVDDVSANDVPDAITPLVGLAAAGGALVTGAGAGALVFGCPVRGVVVRRGGAGGGVTGTSFN